MSSAEFSIRAGTAGDVEGLAAFHQWRAPGFEAYLRSAAERGELLVAERQGTVSAYAAWNRSFFLRPFVSYLAVNPAVRRGGAGRALLEAVEERCAGERLFLSTNESNTPMHALLATCGYRRCGMVDELDPGDPEIFYCKDVAGAARVLK